MNDETVTLNDTEAMAMAWAIVRQKLDEPGDLVEWEDVGLLDERSYDRLCDCLSAIASGTAVERLLHYKAIFDADGEALLWKAGL